jgi:hypothetical protein
MAARLNPKQDARSREAIKTTQLVKRLQCFALDELDDAGNVVELDPSRIRAIETLLKKTLPDLSATTISGDPDNPIKTEEVGSGSAKVLAALEAIAERSGTAGQADAE